MSSGFYSQTCQTVLLAPGSHGKEAEQRVGSMVRARRDPCGIIINTFLFSGARTKASTPNPEAIDMAASFLAQCANSIPANKPQIIVDISAKDCTDNVRSVRLVNQIDGGASIVLFIAVDIIRYFRMWITARALREELNLLKIHRYPTRLTWSWWLLLEPAFILLTLTSPLGQNKLVQRMRDQRDFPYDRDPYKVLGLQ